MIANLEKALSLARAIVREQGARYNDRDLVLLAQAVIDQDILLTNINRAASSFDRLALDALVAREQRLTQDAIAAWLSTTYGVILTSDGAGDLAERIRAGKWRT